MYKGGLNAGTWAASIFRRPTEPSHINPRIMNDPDWRRGYEEGNAEWFRRNPHFLVDKDEG